MDIHYDLNQSIRLSELRKEGLLEQNDIRNQLNSEFNVNRNFLEWSTQYNEHLRGLSEEEIKC